MHSGLEKNNVIQFPIKERQAQVEYDRVCDSIQEKLDTIEDFVDFINSILDK